MVELSAGIMLYRRGTDGPEVLLVHPGGPFWSKRDAGAWQIPKGGVQPGEAPLQAARREFEEELGSPVSGTPQPLARIRQAGGKHVEAFACEGEFDVTTLASMTFELEWPPRSGRHQSFPEIDCAQWFPIEAARSAMLASQRPLLEAIEALLASRPSDDG